MMFEFGSFLINTFEEMELISYHEPHAFGISFYILQIGSSELEFMHSGFLSPHAIY